MVSAQHSLASHLSLGLGHCPCPYSAHSVGEGCSCLAALPLKVVNLIWGLRQVQAEIYSQSLVSSLNLVSKEKSHRHVSVLSLSCLSL